VVSAFQESGGIRVSDGPMKEVRALLADPEARRRIAESQELIDDVVAHGDTVYGVNTGFGQLASVRISAPGPPVALPQK